MTMLYCESAPELRLGPGPAKDYDDPDVIRFRNGFAEISDSDPRKAEKLLWVASSSEKIEIGEDVEERVLPDNPNAFVCAVMLADGTTCPKAFISEKARRMHRFSHARGNAS
jgi:hypothetical protein